jgi:hypothetical protein
MASSKAKALDSIVASKVKVLNFVASKAKALDSIVSKAFNA